MTVESITAALRAEFADDVAFATSPPAVYRPASVVVLPDPENWLDVKMAGASAETIQVIERWDVLGVASMENQGAGIVAMRQWALRAVRAVSSGGAVWDGSTIQAVPGEANRPLVAVVNKFHFTYTANEHLPSE